MNISDATAIYAAIVASVNAAWTIYREITKNRPRVRVDAMFGDLQIESDASESTGTRWLIRITNIGHVSVTLSHVSYQRKEGKQPTVLFSLRNKEFKAGESVHYGPAPGPKRNEVKMLWAEDTTGRRFRAKRFVAVSGRVMPIE
jgi:hypothetical protein